MTEDLLSESDVGRFSFTERYSANDRKMYDDYLFQDVFNLIMR